MTRDEADRLIERATRDREFRQRLLTQPRPAAAELDVAVSEGDADMILSGTQRVQYRTAGFDRMRDRDRRVLIFMKVAGSSKSNTLHERTNPS